MIQLPVGTKVWIAAGVTDLRRGFDGLSAQVQNVLHEQPFSGHVFVFRGRRGDIVKLLWWDGDGLSCSPTNWLHTTPLSIASEGFDLFGL